MENFAVFILTHGRAESQKTLKTFLDNGYTGEWYLVVDDLDKELELYKELYGSHVLVFDKVKEQKKTDTMTTKVNPDDLKSVLYARNWVQRYAKNKGYKYILMTDDDHTGVNYRYGEGTKLKSKPVTNYDKLFELYVEYLKCSENMYAVAFAKGGAFIGGLEGWKDKIHSLGVFSTAFLKTDNFTEFYGVITEDLNASLSDLKLGRLHFSPVIMHLVTGEKQKHKGGMTDIYEDTEYETVFYPVIAHPDVCYVLDDNTNLSVRTNWTKSVPKILSEDIKKVEK